MKVRVRAEGSIKCRTDDDAFAAVMEAYEFTMKWGSTYALPESMAVGEPQRVDDDDTFAWFDIDMYVGDVAKAYTAAQDLAAFLHQWSHRWNVGEHLDIDDIVEVHVSETMKETNDRLANYNTPEAEDGTAQED